MVHFILSQWGGRHHLLINDTSKEIGFYNSSWYSSGYKLTVGEWYHLALVKNGNNSKLYINGDIKQDSNNSFNNASYPLAVIGNYGGHTQGARGIIDNVQIYNEALSSSQIQQHYAQGAPAHGIAKNE